MFTETVIIAKFVACWAEWSDGLLRGAGQY